jgi:hypothetical protein
MEIAEPATLRRFHRPLSSHCDLDDLAIATHASRLWRKVTLTLAAQSASKAGAHCQRLLGGTNAAFMRTNGG